MGKRNWYHGRRLASQIFLCLLACPLARAQRPPAQNPQPQRPSALNQQGISPERLSTITINVRAPDGSPYLGIAAVNLYKFGGGSAGIGSNGPGGVEFTNLEIGSYTAEVSAPGYKKVSEVVEISTARQ